MRGVHHEHGTDLSEISRKAAKSIRRGIAEPPQMIILGWCFARGSRTWS